MVLLTKKRREIGGQRVDELLPLWPIMRLQPGQIFLKAGVARLAQPPGQTAVDHRMLLVMQVDARALVNQRLHPGEVGLGPDKLARLPRRHFHGPLGNLHSGHG